MTSRFTDGCSTTELCWPGHPGHFEMSDWDPPSVGGESFGYKAAKLLGQREPGIPVRAKAELPKSSPGHKQDQSPGPGQGAQSGQDASVKICFLSLASGFQRAWPCSTERREINALQGNGAMW